MKTTVDMFTDGMFVYVTIQGRQYALDTSAETFEMDHPRLYRKLVAGKGR